MYFKLYIESYWSKQLSIKKNKSMLKNQLNKSAFSAC